MELLMKKDIRKQIYDKYQGHCAYCGCELEYKDMQIDHITPIFHNIKGKNPYGVIQGTDDIENYNPSCRACNNRKSSFSIEAFRNELEKTHERMLRDNANYRQMIRYGQIKLINEGKIKFFYEKVSQ